MLSKMVTKQKEAEGEAIQWAMAKMDDPALMERMHAKLEADLNATLLGSGSNSATNAPAS